MYDLIQLLMQIGLTTKESQAYLICLKIGTNPASIIAKHAELNRCTTYSVLESLIKKGLVYQVEKDTIRYFTAVGPRQLTIYLEEKKRDLSYYKNEIDSRINEFNSLRHPNQVLPKIKSYSGKAGMNKLFNDSLNEPFLLINAQEGTTHNRFFKQYAPIFLNEKKIIHLSLRGSSEAEDIKLSKSSELKTLPYCVPIEFIGKQKLFIIDSKDNYGIGINQTRIIEAHQQQFHHLWNAKKDPSR
jgi:sugar-specific transcriptional regulator TrmB